MKTFCLPPSDVVKFRNALKEKNINIAELINMDTPTRTELLRTYAGESAPQVNLLFEQKLVLKNKIKGIENWASKVGNIGRYSPEGAFEFKKKVDEYKAKQMERILSPKEHEAFLNDLADIKLGTHVTKAEAKTIFETTRKVEELKKNYNEVKEEWTSPKDRADYGAAKVIAENYINKLKTEDLTIKQRLSKRVGEFKETWKDNKASAIIDIPKDLLKAISENSISFVASADNSFIGRQGLHTLRTHPSVWFDMAKKSFSDMYNTLKSKHGGDAVNDALMADAYSRPNYINGNYDIAKLIPKTEEQYPTSLPQKIPFIGRAFRASENAFINSAVRARINTFDLLYDMAKKNGVDIKDKVQIEAIGDLVNSATARGKLGEIGQGGLVRTILWAPKMLKANWDVLTAHTFGKGLKSEFARKQALINLTKTVAEYAAFAAVINAIMPGSVEVNPLSSDFMKIRINNTTYDITGGAGSLIVFLSRGLSVLGGDGMKYKTTKGQIKKINSGKFGEHTYFDMGIDFLANKTTPLTRIAINRMKGQSFDFTPPTLGGDIAGLTVPITIKNFYENIDGKQGKNSPEAVVGSVVDFIGINSATYKRR